MRRTLFGLVGLTVLLLVGHARADEESDVPATLPELQSAIAEALEEHEIPAVGIAMVDANGPVWVGALGKASLEDDVDANADSLFRIGSTSKMFVALAVLKLVEEGTLSLNDKLADLAPEIEFENQWEDTDPVRIAHLLEHTTGWDDIHLPEYAHSDPTPATLKEGLDFHPHSRISRWKPGSRMSYCNAGPPVAAYVVQKLTGQEFEAYVQENFFDPLGMTTATYRQSKDVLERGVTLYNGTEPQDYWHIVMRPSGSINASPNDMARLASFFVNRGNVDGQQLVSEASLRRMEYAATTPASAAGQEIGYGLNNYSSRHKSWIYREHNGGVNGGLTEFAYLPEARVGHAIMINAGSGAGYRAISDLVRDFETRDLSPPEPVVGVSPGPGNESIAGLYQPINPRQETGRFLEQMFGIQTLRFNGDDLQVSPLLDDDTRSYVPVSDRAYRDKETGAVSLVQVEDPLAGAVVHNGTLVLKPVSGVVAYGRLVVGALWGLSIVISILYAFVWGVRRLRGRIAPGATIRIRVYPFLAGLSAIGFVLLFISGMDDPFNALGKPTAVSIGIMLMTLLFALFTALGLLTAYKARNEPMNRVNYWFATTSSVLHGLVVAYLAWFGIIGLATWA